MNKNELKTASFRGIEFSCRAIGGTRGRRIVVHEFPGKDDITIDDLGRSARQYRLEAVFTGEDWQERYNQMLSACEQEGVGDLVHPEGYKVRAVLSEMADHSISSVGEAIVTLTFVEVPEIIQPESLPDPDTVVGNSAADLFDRAKAKFSSVFKSSAKAIQNVQETIETVKSTVAKLAPPKELKNALAGLQVLDATITSLVKTPSDLADQWNSIFDALSDVSTLAKLSADIGSQAQASYDAYQMAISSALTAEEIEKQASIFAHDYFLWCVSMGAWAKGISAVNWTSYTEAKEAVDSCNAALLLAENYTDDAETIMGLMTVRGSLSESVLVQAQLLPRLMDYQPERVMSSAELAQLLYQDGSRGDEIVSRNNLQHPGFIPIEPLKVLTS